MKTFEASDDHVSFKVSMQNGEVQNIHLTIRKASPSMEEKDIIIPAKNFPDALIDYLKTKLRYPSLIPGKATNISNINLLPFIAGSENILPAIGTFSQQETNKIFRIVINTLNDNSRNAG